MRLGPRDCVPGSEYLMHMRRIHEEACVHVLNMLSQDINKVNGRHVVKRAKTL